MISKVVPLDQHIEQDKVSDPHQILGVAPGVSDAELKDVYRALSSMNHPDKVQSSGLSPQFTEMANTRMARINDAYRRILAQRRAAAAGNANGRGRSA